MDRYKLITLEESANDMLMGNISADITMGVSNLMKEDIHKARRGDLIDENNDSFNVYMFHDIPVPRVTKILKRMINNEGLLYWAANVGIKGMHKSRFISTTIGTKVHYKIDHFLKEGIDIECDYFNLNVDEIRCIDQAYDNFKSWYNNLIRMGYTFTPLASEIKVVSHMYGGTVDLIANINGYNYIIDWKTSKQISLEYYLQLAAYMWAINNGFCKEVDHVDGIGIVRLDKYTPYVEESFLTYQIPEHAQYINHYIKTFESLLYGYYNLTYAEQFKHKYPMEDILEEIDDRHN